MFFFRIILMALQSLRANWLRAILATVGIIIGVGAVISANGVLYGARKKIYDQFDQMGANLVTVFPRQARRGGRTVGTWKSLKSTDVEILRNESKYVKSVLPQISGQGQIKYFNHNMQAEIVGTNTEFGSMFNLKLAGGEFLHPDDIAGSTQTVVLGYKVARELFGGTPAVGKAVKLGINRTTGFKVIGVLEQMGQKGFRNMDEIVLIPISTAQTNIFGIRFIESITLQAKDQASIDPLTDDVKRTLRRLHRIRAGDEDDFQILNPQEWRNQIAEFTQIWALVLYTISGISLVVGGIGIMNIMLVSVTERTREIGVRIAVGARSIDILNQFLIEASTISLLGGAIGVFLGFALCNFLTSVSNDMLKTQLTASAVIMALLTATTVGVVSGIYPAYKASRLDPVEALRYE